jgi:hypothetical protein
MNIAFTICSNNYLAQAKTLGDSINKYNPEYKFVIALVDRFSDKIDYDFFLPNEVVKIEDVGVGDFETMVHRYTIIELNTAVKPSVFKYLFNKYPSAENVIYFDPDIMLYDKLTVLEDGLKENNIILTPHFFTPIFDDKKLAEPDILNAGLYNLGFIAVRKSAETDKMLEWWTRKLKNECVVAFDRGLFVDQLWINFVPIYFEKVKVLKQRGHNMAYWNLHERIVLEEAGKYYVNDKQTPLVFFHFSGYTFIKTNIISKYQNRFTFEDRPDILPLFDEYTKLVLANKHQEYADIPCYFVELKKEGDMLLRKQDNLLKRGNRYLKRKWKAYKKNK